MRECEACGGPTKSRGSKKFLGPLRFFCGKPECQKEKSRLLYLDYLGEAEIARREEARQQAIADRESERRLFARKPPAPRPRCGDPTCDDEHGDLPITHWFF